jgi:endonuclease III
MPEESVSVQEVLQTAHSALGETKQLLDATFEEAKARLYANVIQLESALAAVQIELASTVAQLGQTNEKLIALTQAHDALQVDHERASAIDPYDDDIRQYESTSVSCV